MINRIVKMTFDEGNASKFEALFDKIKEKVRHQPGCHHLELWRDINTPNTYFTFSRWDGQQDLDRYRGTELFGGIWKETKALFADRAAAWSVEQILVVDPQKDNK